MPTTRLTPIQDRVTVPFLVTGITTPDPGPVTGVLRRIGDGRLTVAGTTHRHGTHWMIEFDSVRIVPGHYLLIISNAAGYLFDIPELEVRDSKEVGEPKGVERPAGRRGPPEFTLPGDTAVSHLQVTAAGTAASDIVLAKLIYPGETGRACAIVRPDASSWIVRYTWAAPDVLKNGNVSGVKFKVWDNNGDDALSHAFTLKDAENE